MIVIPDSLLSSGERIPFLGLGTWQLTGSKCFNAVKAALHLGYSHIDTAEYYGNESEIGKAINESGIKRKNLFPVSKLWPSNLGYEKTLNALNNSLSRLDSDFLDLYLIHWPKKGMDLSGTFRAFRKLFDDGKVKSFGVSNFTVRHLKEAIPVAEKNKIKISVNQVEFHPGLFQKELLEFCNENKIKITAYSPLGRGLLAENKILNEIGKIHGKSALQVSLKWLLQKGMVVIPKASNEIHLKENLDVFDFILGDEEMNKIDALGNSGRLVAPAFSEF